MLIAISRHLSNSTLTNLISLKSQGSSTNTNVIFVPSAKDLINELPGKNNEHILSLPLLARALGTDINESNFMVSRGLTLTTAEISLEKYGYNTLTPFPKLPMWLHFLLQFTNLLKVLLMITGISFDHILFRYV
jgi:hypothetical protein